MHSISSSGTEETSAAQVALSAPSAMVELANGNITQIVTYTAKFVDRISEITDAMNINGTLDH